MTFPDPGYSGRTYPEQSGAVLVFVFGILGLLFCQLLSPVAWVMGSRELEGIDAGRRPPTDRSLAVVGRILGIIGTFVLVGGMLMMVLGVLLVVAG